MPLQSIDEQIAAIDAALGRVVEDAVKAVTLDVTARLVEATPVDTGWARANWIPSVAQPVETVEGTRDSVSTARQATGIAAIASYKYGDGPTYAANCVPYIAKLDQGSSTQAPAGFVRQAVDEAVVAAQERATAGVTVMRDQLAELNALLGVG